MRIRLPLLAAVCAAFLALFSSAAEGQAPINVGFLWHMHQPTYIPGQTVTQTNGSGQFSFSVNDVHNQRFGPYTSWPKDAIDAGLSLPNLGAQVSFSGSLIENLNNLEANGVNGGMWNNWNSSYSQAQQLKTAEGNQRLDMIGFAFNHALMPLLDQRDMRMQIKLQKQIASQTWGGSAAPSKGFFPPETAFSERMIPALVAEGVEWSIVDNIHFDRATENYPYTPASNLIPPNRADQINPDPAANGGAWVQLNNLWAPSKVSAPFSYRPSNVQYVDPNTGATEKIVAVPAARYEGNEDGRGGFGAFLYDQVMDQYLPYNTDATRPMFTLLHHDGDNFGGGSEGYYHGNFQNMVNWAANDPDYNVTTVQDYLDKYPVPQAEVIHVEPGSWAGADNGDAEFKKWLGDPNASGWSPDRNSWAVLTAAKNRVFTADDIAPVSNLQNILDGTGSPTEKAWKHLMAAESSDYWYWDGTEVWDSNVTRGSNLAVAHADQVIASFGGTETTGPTVFLPQRESYNPGGTEWGPNLEPSDFEVWTFAYDVSGLSNVTLKWRTDNDGVNPLASTDNETYAGGAEVGVWNSIAMNSSDIAPPGNILDPTYRALRYGAMIEGQQDALLDYYVEAVDGNGNITRSDIQHVYVGEGQVAGFDSVTLGPDPAIAGQPVTISFDPAGGPLASATEIFLHYGFDDWNTVASPDSLMNWNASAELWDLTVPVSATASTLDLVFNDGNGTWDNNGGQDWHFAVSGTEPPPFVMDGILDTSAIEIAVGGGRHIYVALAGDTLYLATEDAGEGDDVFLYLAEALGPEVAANWAKSGQVAQWDAFLADENDNGFNGWFDNTGSAESATGTNGGVIEGIINLAEEFGALPAEIFLALGVYESADGGELVYQAQLPGSNDSDGDIDADEYLLFQLLLNQSADFDGDFDVDSADLATWIASFGSNNNADTDGDNDTDGADFLAWQRQFTGSGSVAIVQTAAVPEPSTAAFCAIGIAALLIPCRRGFGY